MHSTEVLLAILPVETTRHKQTSDHQHCHTSLMGKHLNLKKTTINFNKYQKV